ncbi:MAG: DUF3566 domain-containing protein [Candidatus Nanopelagicales bacterium]
MRQTGRQTMGVNPAGLGDGVTVVAVARSAAEDEDEEIVSDDGDSDPDSRGRRGRRGSRRVDQRREGVGRDIFDQPPAAAKGTRVATLRLRRIDPWSAMKTGFVFAIGLGLMYVVAAVLLYPFAPAGRGLRVLQLDLPSRPVARGSLRLHVGGCSDHQSGVRGDRAWSPLCCSP